MSVSDRVDDATADPMVRRVKQRRRQRALLAVAAWAPVSEQLLADGMRWPA